MFAEEMRAMRKEMEQDFTGKLSKVYDEVRIKYGKNAHVRQGFTSG